MPTTLIAGDASTGLPFTRALTEGAGVEMGLHRDRLQLAVSDHRQDGRAARATRPRAHRRRVVGSLLIVPVLVIAAVLAVALFMPGGTLHPKTTCTTTGPARISNTSHVATHCRTTRDFL